ncbi:hypothetical protein [Nodosilinea sp. E11]|uniref:hypothetical protein n=1 Tax=Nodosilinea sp. E11 TaxID=3037479 RepID=UPI002934235E|nr:hypothetical protein [Nodosilinea sp. E11]WOD36944.1 hypothetical protein RRF56_00280 [Nodosilinea sp. E11]
MFEYLEPDASDDQGNPGTGSLPLSSGAGGNDRGTRSLKPSTPEKVRHMLYGSLAGIDRTIKILHAHGYTDPNDWSDPIPVPPTSDILSPASSGAEMWMAIATKTVLIE